MIQMSDDPLLHFMAANIYITYILAIIAMSFVAIIAKHYFNIVQPYLDMYAHIQSCAHTRNA